MDAERFDAFVRRVLGESSRRGVLRAGIGSLAASALVALGLSAADEAAAKKAKNNKKKATLCLAGDTIRVAKKKKKKLLKQGATAGECAPAPPSPCPGQTTCPANSVTTCCPQGDVCCAAGAGPADGCCSAEFENCCPTSVGGGCCETGFPSCCPLDSAWECCPADNPACCPAGAPAGCCPATHQNCCTADEGGGCCPNQFPTCCPPNPANSADKGICCKEGEECCIGGVPGCPEGTTCDAAPDESGCCVPDDPGAPRARSSGRKLRGHAEVSGGASRDRVGGRRHR